MREILLDAQGWTTAQDFYDSFLPAVEAPAWHGDNLDALWDSITKGDINAVQPPYRIRIVNFARAGPACRDFMAKFDQLIADARRRGVPVELVCER